MANMDRFVGYDYANNPITENYNFHGDARYTARSEEAADISNWNMMLYQNQYNTPTEQVKRLEEAGLNPLFYLANNAGTTPAASGGSAQGHQMTGKSGEFEQLLQAVNTINASAENGLALRKMNQEYEVASEANKINAYNAQTSRMLAGSQVPLNQSMQDYYDYGLTPKTQREVAKIDEEIKLLVDKQVLTQEQAKEAEAHAKELGALEKYYTQMEQTAGSQAALNYAMREFYGSYKNYYDTIADPMAKELTERAGMNTEEARLFSHQATKALFEGNITQFTAQLYRKYGESQQIATIANIWSDTAYKGMTTIEKAVDVFYNVSSGGLYGGFKNSTANPNFNWNPQAKSLETIPKRNPIGFGTP